MTIHLIIRTSLIIIVLSSSLSNCRAQESYNPYELTLNRELGFFTGGVLLSVAGVLGRTGKTPFELSSETDGTNTSDIPSFDVSAVEQSDATLLKWSDYCLYGSLALPLVNLVDGKVNDNAVTTIVLYVETMFVSAGAYLATSGFIDRRRPLTYNPDFTIEERTASNVKDSFFSGHTCLSASAAYCGAKIFSDFHPESKLRPVIWTAAATLPAFIGFARYKAGKHFPSDVITGYIVGGSIGFLIPELHRIDKKQQVILSPLILDGAQGLSLTYNF